MQERFGRFLVSQSWYDRKLEVLAGVFAELGLVPVRVECMYFQHTFEVVGYSQHFQESPDKRFEALVDYEVLVQLNDMNELVCLEVVAKKQSELPLKQGWRRLSERY